MLNFVKVEPNNVGYACWMGDQIAYLEDRGEIFYFTYEVGEDRYCYGYNSTVGGIENALWEWIVTLDKYVSGRGRRLGRMRNVTA